MPGIRLFGDWSGRVTATILVIIPAAFLGVSSSEAAGGGFLRILGDSAGTVGRKIDPDAPPLERAMPMMQGGDLRQQGRLAVLHAPKGRAYHLVAPDGSHLVFGSDAQLLSYLDEIA